MFQLILATSFGMMLTAFQCRAEMVGISTQIHDTQSNEVIFHLFCMIRIAFWASRLGSFLKNTFHLYQHGLVAFLLGPGIVPCVSGHDLGHDKDKIDTGQNNHIVFESP